MRKRRAHSRRDAIRQEIERRIRAGESLSQRAVLAVTGGSASTYIEERDKVIAAVSDREILLTGGTDRNPASRQLALQQQLKASLLRERELKGEIRTLRLTLDSYERTLQDLLVQTRDVSGQLMREIRDLRQGGALKLIAQQPARVAAATGPSLASTDSRKELDVLDQHRFQRLQRDHVRLSQEFSALTNKYEALRKRFYDSTGEWPD